MKHHIFVFKERYTFTIRRMFDDYGKKNLLCSTKIFQGIVEPRWLYWPLYWSGRMQYNDNFRVCAIEAETKDGNDSMMLFKLQHGSNIIMQTAPIEIDDFIDCVYEMHKEFVKTQRRVGWDGIEAELPRILNILQLI